MTRKLFEYDPNLMDKARWNVGGRLYWAPERQIGHEIERQLEYLLACQLERQLELSLSKPCKPKKKKIH